MSASIPWSSNFRSTVYDYSSSDDDVSDTEGIAPSNRQSTVTTYADADLPASESANRIETQEATRVAGTNPLYADLDNQEDDVTFTETPFTIAKRQAFFRRQRALTNGSINSVSASQRAPQEDHSLGHPSPEGSPRALSISASATASTLYHTSTNSADTTATQLLTSPSTEPSGIGIEDDGSIKRFPHPEQEEPLDHSCSRAQASIDRSVHYPSKSWSQDQAIRDQEPLRHPKEFPALKPAHLALDESAQGACQSRLCFQSTSRRTLGTVLEHESEGSEVSTPHRQIFRGAGSLRSQSPSVASDASTSIYGEGFYFGHNFEQAPQSVSFSVPNDQVQRSPYFIRPPSIPKPAETASSPWLSQWSGRKRPLSAVDEERIQSRGTSPSNCITISDSDDDHENVFAYDPHRGTVPLVSNQLPLESPGLAEQPMPRFQVNVNDHADIRSGSWIQEELQKWQRQKVSMHSESQNVQHTRRDIRVPSTQGPSSTVLDELQKWRNQRQTIAQAGGDANTRCNLLSLGAHSPSQIRDTHTTSTSQRLSLFSYSPADTQSSTANHRPFRPDDTATTRARKRQHVERSLPSMPTSAVSDPQQSTRSSSIQLASSRRLDSSTSTRTSGSYRFHNAPSARGKAIALKRFRLPLLPSRPPLSKLPQERRDIEEAGRSASSASRTALQPMDQNRREGYSIKRVPPGMQVQVETRNISAANDGTGAAATRRLTLFKPSPLPSDA